MSTLAFLLPGKEARSADQIQSKRNRHWVLVPGRWRCTHDVMMGVGVARCFTHESQHLDYKMSQGRDTPFRVTQISSTAETKPSMATLNILDH